jgi:hypothetical protein
MRDIPLPQQTHYEYSYSPKKKHRSKNCTYIRTRCKNNYSNNRTQNTSNHKPYINHALSRYHNNVQDNKDVGNAIHLRVLVTDPNGWKGSYERRTGKMEGSAIKLNKHYFLKNNQV